MRAVWIFVTLSPCLLVTVSSAQGPVKETAVGASAKLEDVILPGSELEAKPIENRKVPVVLRVVRATRHGTAFRYDLEYYGLDPGTYNLCDYLRRADGTPAKDLPPLTVKVNALRPPGQVEPNKLAIDPGPRVGGYWLLVYGAAAVWVLGVVALVASFFFPRRKRE